MAAIQELEDLEKVDESLPRIPEDITLRTLSTLNVDHLKQRLSDAGVKHQAKILKAELQALWAFHTMRILGFYEKPQEAELFVKTVRWFKIPVSQVLVDVKSAGLGKCANKWDYIEALIRDGYTPPDPKLETKVVVQYRGVVEDALAELDISNAASTPHYSVVNLLLSTVYSDVANDGTFSSVDLVLPGCTFPRDDLLKHINQLPLMTSAHHLRESLKVPRSPEFDLLGWLCTELGHIICPAEGNLKIAGLPESAHQFILEKPAQTKLDSFEKNFKQHYDNSILLFHGTCLKNLRSILRCGFQPARDRRFGAGLFMADQPFGSSYYAQHQSQAGRNLSHEWTNDLYTNYGMLLCCEVTGNGRFAEHEGAGLDRYDVHVIKRLDSIMIRHIVLLPYAEMYKQCIEVKLRRSMVEGDMLKAFKSIRAKQIGLST
ncbi:uncharacterized protein LY89DRAFT_765574 [Mollisia scopiformis]|uniref:PARP catalytic domain-containing protein n=1 Tax=Mollisia scopiformis TaxID=149040 RepID=A0A132B6Y3_MOLSC|nr:uncharacterized protein LY89DRAFT_765574 [Mollisia scopiformis]KUJ08101.1 hypothetical protein LY89DRAFT_765574 [Mollisia scopiformis]